MRCFEKPRARAAQSASAKLRFSVCAWALALGGCAKKAPPKPVHTEPWLAHPPASASANPDAALPATRYVLTDASVIRFELPTKRGKVQGKLSKVSGELSVTLGALASSRGRVEVDLRSLSLGDDSAESAAWLARAEAALGLADGGASSPPLATFEVTALTDVSPEAIEPARASDGGTQAPRRVRAVAEGNLLLNGFRVLKREPLEAEFGFGGDPAVPASVVIRSRAPLVISLETHEIHWRDPAPVSANQHRNRGPVAPRDIRATIELYGKIP